MTIEQENKVQLLRDFYKFTTLDGWSFQENGPEEKDRILLQQFHFVVKELKALKSAYSTVIVEITREMGNGMAHFIENNVKSIEDYNLYTHYVAGLVGIGLTRLFQASGLEKISNLELANEMGLFLQKVNILKDFLTDINEGRLFWPEFVWKQYVEVGQGPEELAKAENKNRALACLNHLCADAISLVPSCLEYLSQLNDPSVFHFCAIPQVMAMCTFELFYNNYDLFTKRGTKIRKGLAVKIMQNATNFDTVRQMYMEYALRISARARAQLGTNPEDKSFNDIAVNCANVCFANQDCSLDKGL
jgi:farnesyl-diphosphate farnesyltransferase